MKGRKSSYTYIEKDSARFIRGNYICPLSGNGFYFQFTFVKVHFSGRSMSRVFVNGEVVRAEVLS